jgi:hypothetical protein
MSHSSKLASFFIFPAAVFLSHLTVSRILNLYSLFPHIDIPFHFLGGLSIACTSAKILAYLEQEKFIARLNGSIFTILLIWTTAAAAVLWEFMEFTGDQLFHTNIQVSLANTMQDQFMGILGGLTLAFLYGRRQVLQENNGREKVITH